MSLAPGTVLAAPLDDGRWTAYQIVSDDGTSPAIVALDVLEDAPPTLAQVRGAKLLVIDHHSWSSHHDYVHVTPAKPPARWRELGVLPVPDLGPCNAHGGWPDGFSQIVLQRRWVTEIPADVRAAYKACPRETVRVDLGAVALDDVRRDTSELAIGSRAAPLAAGTKLRWAALDLLGQLTRLSIHGDPAGVVEHVRAHPLIAELTWSAHGRATLDLSSTRLHTVSVSADAPLTLRLPDTVKTLRVRGKVDRVTVAQPLAGGRLTLELHGGPLKLPAGLVALRELAVGAMGSIDVAKVAKAFPALETLTVRGDATELLRVEALAKLPRLRSLTLYACYRLDAAKVPAAWPALDRVTIDGHRKVDAAILKRALGAAPRFELRGGKTDAWLAANLDNPFRDWIDRDAAVGKKAAAAWRKARGAKKIDAKVLRAFIDVFNAIDGKTGLDTIDREEIGDAFHELATGAGFTPKEAEAWFDAWRDF